MESSKIIGMIVASLTLACITFVIVLCIVRWLWAWTVPDLFPGAVEWGLVAGQISWLTAIKVSIFVAVLSALFGGHHHHRHSG
jgi:hypothetical protein